LVKKTNKDAPSVFNNCGFFTCELEKQRSNLSYWKDLNDHYDERLSSFKINNAFSKTIARNNPFYKAIHGIDSDTNLDNELKKFPTRNAVSNAIALAEDAIDFWSNKDNRLDNSRKYYSYFLKNLDDSWANAVALGTIAQLKRAIEELEDD
jgi:hypothetical protein